MMGEGGGERGGGHPLYSCIQGEGLKRKKYVLQFILLDLIRFEVSPKSSGEG